MKSSPFLIAVAAAFSLLVGAHAQAAPARLTVFAAASLAGSLDAVDKAYEAKTGVTVAASYGGSMTLAKQLEAGAPGDVFISADEASMDHAIAHGGAAKDSRFDLLSNALVVIAPKSGALKSLTFGVAAWKAALGSGRLSTGDVKSVPVGRYAEASLRKLGLWSLVKDRIAGSVDVRTAMAFVARGEAPLGIVYATDAAAEPGVRVIARVPDDSHPKILYPAALTPNAKAGAKAYLAFLASPEARAIFAHAGFSAP